MSEMWKKILRTLFTVRLFHQIHPVGSLGNEDQNSIVNLWLHMTNHVYFDNKLPLINKVLIVFLSMHTGTQPATY